MRLSIVCASRWSDPSHLSQHDPDDEPCAPPLDPEFFEFDRESAFPASV